MNVEFLEKLCLTPKLVVYLALYTALFPFAGVYILTTVVLCRTQIVVCV